MKTKEEILQEAYKRTLSSDIGGMISLAMDLYAQQLVSDRDREIQRLMAEIDEVKTKHYQQLNDQMVHDLEKQNAELSSLKSLLGRAAVLLDDIRLIDNEADTVQAGILSTTAHIAITGLLSSISEQLDKK